MQKHLVALVAMAAVAAAAGCTASASGTITPGMSPSPGMSAAPGASTTPGGTVTGGATVTAGALASVYKVGRKWTYDVTTTTMGIDATTPMSWEVLSVDNGKAKLKTTVTAAGQTASSESEIDLNATSNPWTSPQGGSSGSNASGTFTQTSSTTESITVKAGTYTATKIMGTFKGSASSDGASATNEQTVTSWYNNDVGLIKQETSGSQTMSGYQVNQTMPAGMPSGFTMPGGGQIPTSGGASGTITFKSTIELTSVTN